MAVFAITPNAEERGNGQRSVNQHKEAQKFAVRKDETEREHVISLVSQSRVNEEHPTLPLLNELHLHLVLHASTTAQTHIKSKESEGPSIRWHQDLRL